MKKRKVTRIVRGRKTVDGAGVHLRRILGEQTVVDFDPFLMPSAFDYISNSPCPGENSQSTTTCTLSEIIVGIYLEPSWKSEHLYQKYLAIPT